MTEMHHTVPSLTETAHLPGEASQAPTGYSYVFIYGTLKNGYCNHYHIQAGGVSYVQVAKTVEPYILYMDHTNRYRPCLTTTNCYHPGGISSKFLECHDPILGTSAPTTPGGSDSSQSVKGSPSPDGQESSRFEEVSINAIAYPCSPEGIRDKALRSGEALLFVDGRQRGGVRGFKEPAEVHNAGDDSHFAPSPIGKIVTGEIFLVKDSLIPGLDAFERCPEHYFRRPIIVEGLDDNRRYFAEVYLSQTSRERLEGILNGSFQTLDNYTMQDHRLYVPRVHNSNRMECQSIFVSTTDKFC